MPVCINCRTKVAKTDKYCKSCGCPIKKRTILDSLKSFPIIKTKKQKAKEIKRIEYIEELDKILKYFGEVQALYDSYDYYRWKLGTFSQQTQQSRYNRYNRRLYSSSLTLGFLGTILLVGSLIIWSVFSFAEAVVGLALSMCFFVVSGVPILCEKSTDKKRKNEENNCYVQMNNLKNELFNHYKAYGDCIINPEYSNPRIVYRIRETIRMGHADSPQEAIDILSKKAGVPIPTNYYPQTIHSGVVNYSVLFLPGNYFDK